MFTVIKKLCNLFCYLRGRELLNKYLKAEQWDAKGRIKKSFHIKIDYETLMTERSSDIVSRGAIDNSIKYLLYYVLLYTPAVVSTNLLNHESQIYCRLSVSPSRVIFARRCVAHSVKKAWHARSYAIKSPRNDNAIIIRRKEEGP